MGFLGGLLGDLTFYTTPLCVPLASNQNSIVDNSASASIASTQSLSLQQQGYHHRGVEAMETRSISLDQDRSQPVDHKRSNSEQDCAIWSNIEEDLRDLQNQVASMRNKSPRERFMQQSAQPGVWQTRKNAIADTFANLTSSDAALGSTAKENPRSLPDCVSSNNQDRNIGIEKSVAQVQRLMHVDIVEPNDQRSKIPTLKISIPTLRESVRASTPKPRTKQSPHFAQPTESFKRRADANLRRDSGYRRATSQTPSPAAKGLATEAIARGPLRGTLPATWTHPSVKMGVSRTIAVQVCSTQCGDADSKCFDSQVPGMSVESGDSVTDMRHTDGSAESAHPIFLVESSRDSAGTDLTPGHRMQNPAQVLDQHRAPSTVNQQNSRPAHTESSRSARTSMTTGTNIITDVPTNHVQRIMRAAAMDGSDEAFLLYGSSPDHAAQTHNVESPRFQPFPRSISGSTITGCSPDHAYNPRSAGSNNNPTRQSLSSVMQRTVAPMRESCIDNSQETHEVSSGMIDALEIAKKYPEVTNTRLVLRSSHDAFLQPILRSLDSNGLRSRRSQHEISSSVRENFVCRLSRHQAKRQSAAETTVLGSPVPRHVLSATAREFRPRISTPKLHVPLQDQPHLSHGLYNAFSFNPLAAGTRPLPGIDLISQQMTMPQCTRFQDTSQLADAAYQGPFGVNMTLQSHKENTELDPVKMSIPRGLVDGGQTSQVDERSDTYWPLYSAQQAYSPSAAWQAPHFSEVNTSSHPHGRSEVTPALVKQLVSPPTSDTPSSPTWMDISSSPFSILSASSLTTSGWSINSEQREENIWLGGDGREIQFHGHGPAAERADPDNPMNRVKSPYRQKRGSPSYRYVRHSPPYTVHTPIDNVSPTGMKLEIPLSPPLAPRSMLQWRRWAEQHKTIDVAARNALFVYDGQ